MLFLGFSHSTSLLPTSNRSKEVMLISFALREFTISSRREIRSLLGFSDKSAKKSHNFRCYAQKPSILPQSCPTSLRRRPWWWRRPPVGIPLSGRVPGRAPRSSRSSDDDGGGLQYVSRKSDLSFRFFPSRGIYRWKGGIRGWTSWSHPLVLRPGSGPRRPRVSLAPGPLCLIFGLRDASEK
jgi:hypothetical protein